MPNRIWGIALTCPVCEAVFYFCQNCWRGRKYCGLHCRQEGRRRTKRKADKKYASTDRGRENRRQRQKNFRSRIILNQRVTDQSRLNLRVKINPPPKSNHDELSDVCCRCQRLIEIIGGGPDEFTTHAKTEISHFSFVRQRSPTQRFSF
jgi:hypothetical protein